MSRRSTRLGKKYWYLTFKEGKVFLNRVLRGIFRPKRDEVKGKWRKFHNEEINNFYSLPNIVRMIKSCKIR
jgi:hypothetical protein